jgi:hypothetical protein
VLAALARRRVTARPHLLHVRAPEAADVAAWLELWMPELGKSDTCIIISGAGSLPAWAVGELAARLAAAIPTDGSPVPFLLTVPAFDALSSELALLVDAVVEAPPLRFRAEDVLPLAHVVARRRSLTFTPRAAAALTAYHWPGNVAQLRRVVRSAASRATVVDLHHLDPEIFDEGGRRLSRLERSERDEIVRCLTEPGQTITHAAEVLGIGRATLYRKIAYYRISLPES